MVTVEIRHSTINVLGRNARGYWSSLLLTAPHLPYRVNMKKLYVGIDVHRQKHQVALIPLAALEKPDSTWRKLKTIEIENNEDDFESLCSTISLHVSDVNEVAIIMDYVGQHYSEPLTYFLSSRGFAIHYLETKGVKAAKERLFDEENKSDTIDARFFAYLMYLRDVHSFSFRISENNPDLGSKAAALNSLILQRQQFEKLSVQTSNRLHQYFLAVFPEGEAQYYRQLLKIAEKYPTPEDMLKDGLKHAPRLWKKHREGLLSLAAHTVGIPGETYRWIIRELAIQRNQALLKKDALTKIINQEVTTHPYGAILLTFPKFGELAAAHIIGTVKDIEKWPDKKKIRKALGIYSRQTQSGNSRYHSHRAREGNRHAKAVLFQVCLRCIMKNTPDNDFKDYYLRQVVKNKPKMKAIVSTMGKMVEIIHHCLQTGEAYEYKGIYKH